MNEDKQITCPAGAPIEGAEPGKDGCFCSVAREFIDQRRNPAHLKFYCRGEYTACATWRTFREEQWARRDKAMMAEVRSEEPRQPLREEVA